MSERRAATISEEDRFLREEYAKLQEITARIEAMSGGSARGRGGERLDRTRATIELLQQRIEWLQTIGRRLI
jgi:hypothetical protein